MSTSTGVQTRPEEAPPSSSPPPYTTSSTSNSSASNEPFTPLPSYTSSPIIFPTLTTSAQQATLALAKLPLAALDEAPQSSSAPLSQANTTTTSSHTHSVSPLTHSITTWAIAFFGPVMVDYAFLTLLNIIGFAFTLVQLPLAIVLARRFNAPHEKQQDRAKRVKKMGKRGQEGLLKEVTQCMWDWHDELEEAELRPPSTWI